MASSTQRNHVSGRISQSGNNLMYMRPKFVVTTESTGHVPNGTAASATYALAPSLTKRLCTFHSIMVPAKTLDAARIWATLNIARWFGLTTTILVVAITTPFPLRAGLFCGKLVPATFTNMKFAE